MNRYFKAKIRENLPLNNSNNLLITEPLDPVTEPKPGQFYMITVGNSYDPLLKRPFSYLRTTPDTIQFLFTVRGRGTALMKALRKGSVVDIIGPLGTGYPLPGTRCTPVVVAGGTGIISLFSLIETLTRRFHVLYGAKNRDDLLLLHELERLGNKLVVCTDDCSFGKEGMVDAVLRELLADHESLSTSCTLYACGPKPMLKAVSGIAAERGLRGYMSLEENMACGFGACLGCAVKTIRGYQRVCREGPVFPIRDIVWEQDY
ncbi:MAG: dihydroorotate dehydrogenase electron transfer subunit [Nitrospirota bacterium]